MSPSTTRDLVASVTLDSGTAAVDLAPPPDWRATQTTATLLTEEFRSIRDQVRQLDHDVAATHQDAHETEWRMRSARLAKANAVDQLNGLATEGFAWRDLARLIGVSVPSIQKWRKGEGLSGDNRKRLADLAAACELLLTHYYVEDVAGWFETPLISGVPITPIDLWAAGRVDLVFEAASHDDPETLVGKHDPDWRSTYSSPFTVVLAEDGQRSIQLREE